MKKIFIVIFVVSILFSFANAQTASATWALTADTAAFVSGNVTAPVQYLSKTPIATDTLVVKDYSGSTAVGAAERLWLNGTSWPTESAKNTGRYIQYSISPLVGNNLTVQSINLNIGVSGSTSAMYASIFYSTDSTFNTSSQLSPATPLQDIRPTPSGTGMFASLSFTPSVLIEEGKTFYLRVYPWWTSSSPSPSKYVCIKNVVISGSTTSLSSPSLAVFPDSIDFGKSNINTSRSIKTLTISGANLFPASDSIRLTAPEGFLVSTSNAAGYTSYLALPYSSGTINATVYAKFLPASIANYGAVISVAGGGVSAQNIKVAGECVNYPLGIFVATTGSDLGVGDFNTPFLTIKKAISVIQAGDTIFVRSGRYVMDTVTVNITANGISTSRYCLFGYMPDTERPLLDFSAMSFGKRGALLSGNYWHIKGLDFYKAGDNGMRISGSNNIIEYCSFFENQGSGLQLTGSASNNQIINCDSYFNYDEPTSGENADGFAPKQMTGVNNYFYGCRAWQNADDGWDCFEAIASPTLEKCWAFSNGYLKDGVTTTSAMDGNGFKMGGNSTENDITLKNCLAFKNKGKGFDQNNNRGSMTLFNCTGYNNGGNNYAISSALSTGKVLTLSNCIELGNKKSIGSFAIQTTNSWLSPFTSASTADFISIDTTGVLGSRKADGSLPDISYMHLISTSQFVNRGTDVGLPYIGTAPDLGCFETDVLSSVQNSFNSRISEFKLIQNYPNPFNPATTIKFQVARQGTAKLQIRNLLGQEIQTLFSGVAQPWKLYTIEFNAINFPSGIYFSILDSGGEKQIRKMILLK